MIRNLKTLLLAAMAVAAIGASAASSAQAHVFENPNGTPIDLTLTPDGTGATAHHVFDVPNNGSITCKKLEGHALNVTGSTQTNVIMKELAYSECTFFGQNATVHMNGCNYNFSAEGTTKIECIAPNKITFEAGLCVVEIEPGQDFATGLTFHVIGSGSSREVTVETHVTGIHGTAGPGCTVPGPFTTGEYTTGNTIVTGETQGTKTMTPVAWS